MSKTGNFNGYTLHKGHKNFLNWHYYNIIRDAVLMEPSTTHAIYPVLSSRFNNVTLIVDSTTNMWPK